MALASGAVLGSLTRPCGAGIPSNSVWTTVSMAGSAPFFGQDHGFLWLLNAFNPGCMARGNVPTSGGSEAVERQPEPARAAALFCAIAACAFPAAAAAMAAAEASEADRPKAAVLTRVVVPRRIKCFPMALTPAEPEFCFSCIGAKAATGTGSSEHSQESRKASWLLFRFPLFFTSKALNSLPGSPRKPKMRQACLNSALEMSFEPSTSNTEKAGFTPPNSLSHQFRKETRISLAMGSMAARVM
mmetsp:Transcript_37501/g.107634  ORF Transcript_37501/g.107634 Transcript_37501/m.107634 type:complete len:244 (-) Transcript_37501:84-815(-)